MKRYNDYATYLKNHFEPRIQKITLHAGFSCPNRDGKVGWGGCTYCNNQSFNPSYCSTGKSVYDQIEEGICFFRKKYPDQKYLAYFQAYTNTYGSLEHLKEVYEEALSHPDVVGLVIGTRPDCIDTDILHYLQELRKKWYIMVEYGIESTLDSTLEFINRGHSFQTAREAILQTAELGIETCAHLILGLPKESNEEILHHADRIADLPLSCIKLHQLQLIKGTKMAVQFAEHPEWFHLYTADEYIDLVIQFMERLPKNFVVERFVSQSPKELLAIEGWGLKNFEFTAKLEKRMEELKSFQGKSFIKKPL